MCQVNTGLTKSKKKAVGAPGKSAAAVRAERKKKAVSADGPNKLLTLKGLRENPNLALFLQGLNGDTALDLLNEHLPETGLPEWAVMEAIPFPDDLAKNNGNGGRAQLFNGIMDRFKGWQVAAGEVGFARATPDAALLDHLKTCFYTALTQLGTPRQRDKMLYMAPEVLIQVVGQWAGVDSVPQIRSYVPVERLEVSAVTSVPDTPPVAVSTVDMNPGLEEHKLALKAIKQAFVKGDIRAGMVQLQSLKEALSCDSIESVLLTMREVAPGTVVVIETFLDED